MFGGMGKSFWGLQVCFFVDLKAASKKLYQNRLFHTTNQARSRNKFHCLSIFFHMRFNLVTGSGTCCRQALILI